MNFIDFLNETAPKGKERAAIKATLINTYKRELRGEFVDTLQKSGYELASMEKPYLDFPNGDTVLSWTVNATKIDDEYVDITTVVKFDEKLNVMTWSAYSASKTSKEVKNASDLLRFFKTL